MNVKDWSLSAWVAGFLAVLISYCGPLVIFIQAAQAAHMPPQALSSWIWAISMGAGLSGLLLSWWLRMPIITAWSAPGTALLLSLFPHISMPEVVGAYLSAAALVVVIGLSGYFEKIVHVIPKGIAAGMMAGILFQFGVQAFRASMDLPAVVLTMLAAYLAGRRFWPRYTVVLVAVLGLVVAAATGKTNLQALELVLAEPVFVAPVFNVGTFLSFTVPLLLVSLTGQYLPGMAVLRLAGYNAPSRAVVTGTGLASLLVAYFGGISIVLVFNAFPPALIAALAGLALIGAIASNIGLLAQESVIEPAVVTFLATASGMTLFGLGAAFWGVVFGMASHGLLHLRRSAA